MARVRSAQTGDVHRGWTVHLLSPWRVRYEHTMGALRSLRKLSMLFHCASMSFIVLPCYLFHFHVIHCISMPFHCPSGGCNSSYQCNKFSKRAISEKKLP
nr:MAG TPA: hypothetical protein [Caudoviricetes sp.]